MPGEISETAKMTTQGNTDGDGAGMDDGVPPAADAGQRQDGPPKDYAGSDKPGTDQDAPDHSAHDEL